MKKPGYLRTILEVWSVRIISVLVAIAGLINMISAIFPAIVYRNQLLRLVFSSQFVLHTARIGTTLSGFFLLIIALSLWRRKQVAWVLAVIVLVLGIVGNLLKGLDIEEASFLLVILVALIYLQPHFHAKSDPPSIKNGILVFIISIFFILSYGTIGFYFLDKHFVTHFNFVASFWQTIEVIFRIGDFSMLPATRFGHFFVDSIPIVAFFTIGYGIFSVLQPVALGINNQKEREKANGIIKKFGRSPLATFALFSDKTYFIFNDVVVSYRIVGRTALVLGDPIGERTNLKKCIGEFVSFCNHNDWRPAFYQVKNESPYKDMGFSALSVGEEACVDLKNYSIDGHNEKKLRNTINRLKSAGFSTEILKPPLTYWQIEELRSVSDDWLESRDGRENAFSQGYFEDDYIRNSSVFVVRDQRKSICAFANIIIIDKAKEIGIDLMRRRLKSENGVMEFLFVELFGWAKGENYLFCNLGLSPLASVGTKHDDPLAEKFLKTVYQNINMFYNFRGLHHFKEKFDPVWSERYLAYPNSVNPLIVASAIIRAHQEEIFPRSLLIKMGKYFLLLILVLTLFLFITKILFMIL